MKWPGRIKPPCIHTRLMLVGTLLIPFGWNATAGEVSFSKTISPFLEGLCVDCHSGKNPKGNLSLENFQADSNSDTWIKILDALVLHEMPPEKETQPTELERTQVVSWIKRELHKAGKDVEDKLARPGYGNYVSHEKLFGAKPSGPSFSPPRIWRIRPDVYTSTLQSLAKASYPKPFTLKTGGHAFRDYDNQYVIAGPDLNQLMANTKKVSAYLIETKESKGQLHRGNRTPEQLFRLIHPENKSPTPEQFAQAVDWLYHRVLLREPSAEEREHLIAFAQKSIQENGRMLGVRNMISAVLLKPESLYRSEQGEGAPDEHGRIRLSSREVAYAIAYALTDSRPDDKLLKSDLSTSEAVEAQVKRLLEDTRTAKPRILGFFREYFEYGGAVDVFKDEALFRSHAPEVLVRDTDRLIMYFYERDQDVLKELLTTRKSFVQYSEDKGKPRRAHAKGEGAHLSYNLPPDWKWIPDQPIDLPGNQRAGVLTQPAWLVAKSDNFNNHAIWRGLWMRKKLVGGTIPDVPITVDAQLPNDDTLTLREKMEVTRETYCWKCHSKMDPLGLGFEMFDHFGRWRTRELGKPVDASAFIVGGIGKKKVEFKDSVELIHKLAATERVRQVFVRHAFRYWMGRNETLDDAATLQAADKAYMDNGGSMKSLIMALLTSDSFLYRKNISKKS